MSYVDIANEESSDIQADGEDYYVALRNLENKYGYDEDIVTIIRMCNQWQNSFHKNARSLQRIYYGNNFI